MDRGRARAAANRVAVEAAHPKARSIRRRVEALARAFLRQLGQSGAELSIALVTDRAIRRLNRIWRDKDQPTDVLSFPAGELPRGTPGPRLLGDIVISLDTAAKAAREHRRTLEEELSLYLAHGLLHLLGYDHQRKADARRMAAMETRLLGRRGMVMVPPP